MKKTLLDEYHEKHNSKKVKVLKSADSDSESDEPDSQGGQKHTAGEGRYQISIEDAVQTVALGDYGADISVLPGKIFDEVKEIENGLEHTMLEKPIRMELACKSMQVEVKRTARLSITIHLPGSNVPVRFRGVEFFIADFEMDEVLLGRPFLNSIGFNLDTHLLQVSKEGVEQGLFYPNGTPKLAAAKYSGLTYQVTDDDPIELPESMVAGIGADSEEYIRTALSNILEEAAKNGISPEGKSRLEDILSPYKDVFRIKLGPDEPAKVEPLAIQRAPGSRPFKTPQRRYAPVQTAFINSTIKDLERVGAVRRNPAAKWASPALAVPKPGTEKLRFTVDLRGVNARTVPVQSAMPHFESSLQEDAGSIFFAKMDLAHGYWQIPLDPASEELMSIQTPLGVYTPTRLLQVGSDSGNHFQSVLQDRFSEVKKLLQWIDDFLIHSSSEADLLDSIETFLKICGEINPKVHAEKTCLFATEVTFCGRIINAEGIRHHPRHFESLLTMKRPTLGEELQQLLCATNWMRTSLPNYAAVVAPLHDLLEDVYQLAGKRTKAAVRKFPVGDSWGKVHDTAFSTIKHQLAAAVKPAHVKAGFFICLF